MLRDGVCPVVFKFDMTGIVKDPDWSRLDEILPTVPEQVWKIIYEKNSEEPTVNRHDNTLSVLNR